MVVVNVVDVGVVVVLVLVLVLVVVSGGGGSCGAAGAGAVGCCGGGGSGRGRGPGVVGGRGRGGACGGTGKVVGACEGQAWGATGVRRCWRGWVRGGCGWWVGGGDPNSVHAAGHKKKATAALLASFSMGIVFDAGVIFFTPIAMPQC